MDKSVLLKQFTGLRVLGLFGLMGIVLGIVVGHWSMPVRIIVFVLGVIFIITFVVNLNRYSRMYQESLKNTIHADIATRTISKNYATYLVKYTFNGEEIKNSFSVTRGGHTDKDIKNKTNLVISVVADKPHIFFVEDIMNPSKAKEYKKPVLDHKRVMKKMLEILRYDNTELENLIYLAYEDPEEASEQLESLVRSGLEGLSTDETVILALDHFGYKEGLFWSSDWKEGAVEVRLKLMQILDHKYSDYNIKLTEVSEEDLTETAFKIYGEYLQEKGLALVHFYVNSDSYNYTVMSREEFIELKEVLKDTEISISEWQ